MRSASERAEAPLCPIPGATWTAKSAGFGENSEAPSGPSVGSAGKFRCDFDNLRARSSFFRKEAHYLQALRRLTWWGSPPKSQYKPFMLLLAGSQRVVREELGLSDAG